MVAAAPKRSSSIALRNGAPGEVDGREEAGGELAPDWLEAAGERHLQNLRPHLSRAALSPHLLQ